MSDLEVREVKKDEILFRMGNTDKTLYRVESGNFLIFHAKGSRIDPIMKCGAGKFMGSFSFFLGVERVVYAVALEDSTVSIIQNEELSKQFPPWLANIGKSLCNKTLDNLNLISNVGIKRKGEVISPLSIEEQRHFFQLIK